MKPKDDLKIFIEDREILFSASDRIETALIEQQKATIERLRAEVEFLKNELLGRSSD